MRAAVITFPGSNCDRDLRAAFQMAGFDTVAVWHKDADLPSGVDIVGIPGGFSYGDYLRCGAIAAQSPICRAVADHAGRGGYVLGICNGFQVLTETKLLPGALMRNAGLKFVCKSQPLRVENAETAFTAGYAAGAEISLPVAHHDGKLLAYLSAKGKIESRDFGEDHVVVRVRMPAGAMGSVHRSALRVAPTKLTLADELSKPEPDANDKASTPSGSAIDVDLSSVDSRSSEVA
jgi:phosphoribosylformylglycinamidine synthase